MDKCKGCSYNDEFFGCLCNKPIYPCEEQEAEDVVSEIIGYFLKNSGDAE